ncbi:MAG TPA: alpha/beta hydrolase [Gemmatimonadaceae bacterium]|jgi:predicted esterase|nr:alpha/beta hydrolase [Gemmatimonadaceae bacterium]
MPPSTTDLEHLHRFTPGEGTNAKTTLLLLHGTGGDENDLVPLGASLLPGAAILSPRGAVSERGAARFFKRLSEGVFDLEDLALRTQQLIRFVNGAVDKYEIDRTRLIAVGLSNGANIAASVMLTTPGVFSHAILFRAMVPFEPTQPVKLGGTPVLISSGEWDPIATPEQARRLQSLLTAAGAVASINFFNAGHQLTREDLLDAAHWIAATL